MPPSKTSETKNSPNMRTFTIFTLQLHFIRRLYKVHKSGFFVEMGEAVTKVVNYPFPRFTYMCIRQTVIGSTRSELFFVLANARRVLQHVAGITSIVTRPDDHPGRQE